MSGFDPNAGPWMAKENQANEQEAELVATLLTAGLEDQSAGLYVGFNDLTHVTVDGPLDVLELARFMIRGGPLETPK